MINSLIAYIFCILLSDTLAEEITFLKNQCIPCTGYGYYYCKEDKNLVNLNETKCYRDVSDKLKSCKEFDFFKNPTNCVP